MQHVLEANVPVCQNCTARVNPISEGDGVATHIEKIGVVDGDPGEQVELIGALRGVPGHVV